MEEVDSLMVLSQGIYWPSKVANLYREIVCSELVTHRFSLCFTDTPPHFFRNRLLLTIYRSILP